MLGEPPLRISAEDDDPTLYALSRNGESSAEPNDVVTFAPLYSSIDSVPAAWAVKSLVLPRSSSTALPPGGERPPESATSAEPELPQRRSLNSALDIDPDHLWLRPLALLSGQAADAALAEGRALRLAGGGSAFAMVELLGRLASGEIVAALGTIAEARRWAAERGGATAARLERQIERLATPRAAWAGFGLDRPLLMGIVNVTPDSFSDGGGFLTRDAPSSMAARSRPPAPISSMSAASRPGPAPRRSRRRKR